LTSSDIAGPYCFQEGDTFLFVSVFGPILCVIIGDRRIDKKATQGVSRLQVLESEAHRPKQ
jgi:hypothetical protein